MKIELVMCGAGTDMNLLRRSRKSYHLDSDRIVANRQPKLVAAVRLRPGIDFLSSLRIGSGDSRSGHRRVAGSHLSFKDDGGSG